MDPETQKAIDDVRNGMADLANRLSDIEKKFESPTPIREIELPPHFHRVDRISYKDLRDGFTILDATPSQVAEEGTCVLYRVGAAVRVAFKVDQTWRTAALS